MHESPWRVTGADLERHRAPVEQQLVAEAGRRVTWHSGDCEYRVYARAELLLSTMSADDAAEAFNRLGSRD